MFLRDVYQFTVPKAELAIIRYSCDIYYKRGDIEIYFHQGIRENSSRVEAIRSLLGKSGIVSELRVQCVSNYDNTLSRFYYIRLTPQDFRAAVGCLYLNKKIWRRDHLNILLGPVASVENKL